MKIGLDIDGVLANFPEAVITKAKELGIGDKFPETWKDVDCWFISKGNCPDTFGEVWKHVKDDLGFWLKLKPFPYSLPLDFTPACYITSRPIESWVSEQWLRVNGFPAAPVVTVSKPFDKLGHIKERGLDLFVDDHWETVRYLIENGVNAVLYEAPYQKGHDTRGLVTAPTLKGIKEFYAIYGEELFTNCG